MRIVCPLLGLQEGCTTSPGRYVHHSQCVTLSGVFPVRSHLILPEPKCKYSQEQHLILCSPHARPSVKTLTALMSLNLNNSTV